MGGGLASSHLALSSVVLLCAVVGRSLKGCGLELAGARLSAAMRESERSVVYYWVQDSLGLALLLGSSTFGRGVCHACGDTLLGDVTARILDRAGRPTLRLRRSGGAVGVGDVMQIVRARGVISISADGSGSYGSIDPALGKLVARRGGYAIPLAARASRAIRLPWAGGVEFPVPGARIGVSVGEPVRPLGDQDLIGEAEMRRALVRTCVDAAARIC